MSEQTPSIVSEQTPNNVSDQTLSIVSEQTPNIVSDQTQNIVSDQTPSTVSEQTPSAVSRQTPTTVPAMPEQTPRTVSGQTPITGSENTLKTVTPEVSVGTSHRKTTTLNASSNPRLQDSGNQNYSGEECSADTTNTKAVQLNKKAKMLRSKRVFTVHGTTYFVAKRKDPFSWLKEKLEDKR